MGTAPQTGGPPDTDQTGTRGGGGAPAAVYTEVQGSESFGRLRRTHRRFAFPMTAGFCSWYLLYVLLSSYAPGFMGSVLFGHINVAFVFGILQFASTFVIAWLYARYAGARLDGQAAAIKADVERRTTSGAVS